MTNKNPDLCIRTKSFSLALIKFYSKLPKTTEAQVIGKQLLRSGTSVGAQYHEAKQARSKAEFISKIGGALQELEETIYWLDLLDLSHIKTPPSLPDAIAEAKEIKAMLIATSRTIKAKK